MPTIHRTITGGSLFVVRLGTPDFNFAATNLSVSFRLGDSGGLPVSAGPFAAGAMVGMSGALAGDQTLRVGSVDLAGVAYPSLFFAGTLQFDADAIAITANSPTPLRLSTPFTLTGTLDAYQENPFLGDPGPRVFRAVLNGHGTATLRCSPSIPDGTGGQVRDLSSLFYGFE